MYSLERQRRDFKRTKGPNKVLKAISKINQTNPDVSYKATPHAKEEMRKRNISVKDMIKSIEEFEKQYEKNDKTVVEKKIGEHVLRTVYSYNMYTNEVFVITSYHINKRKFATPQRDQFSL